MMTTCRLLGKLWFNVRTTCKRCASCTTTCATQLGSACARVLLPAAASIHKLRSGPLVGRTTLFGIVPEAPGTPARPGKRSVLQHNDTVESWPDCRICCTSLSRCLLQDE